MAEGHNVLAKLFLSLVALLHPQYIMTGPLVKSYLNTRVSKVVVCRDAAFFNRFRSFVKLSKEMIFQLRKQKTLQVTLSEKLSLHQINVCLFVTICQ